MKNVAGMAIYLANEMILKYSDLPCRCVSAAITNRYTITGS